MEFRQAKQDDLLPLLRMYEKIIQKMNAEGIQSGMMYIPVRILREISKNRRFFVAQEGDSLQRDLLCAIPTTGRMQWIGQSRRPAPVTWIVWGQPGVRRAGRGGQMLSYAMALARQKGAAYLRLFVVDCNLPAIGLYRKSGFVQAGGVYEEQIDKDLSLREYGFEIRLSPMNPHPPSR